MADNGAMPLGRFFRRFGRLASHHPLLWHTRMTHVFLCVLVADSSLSIFGSVWVIQPANIPTINDVSNLVSGLRIVAFLALIVWAGLQVRGGLGEWPVRHYVAVGACYALCWFGALTAPIFLGDALVGQIRTSVADEEVNRDYKSHEPFGFWACDDRITEEAVASHADEIRLVFDKYGLQTKPRLKRFSWEEKYCKKMQSELDVYDASGNRVSPGTLRDRLKSLIAAKGFRTGEGPYHDMLFGNLVWVAMVSIVLAIVLLAASLPRAFWSRRFGHHIEEASLPQFSLPQPEWLRRLDHWLVTRHPRIWATRLPTFLFNTLVYGGSAALAVNFVVRTLFPTVTNWFGGEHEIYGAAFYMALGAILPASWAFAQRGIRLGSRSTYEDLGAILAFSVSTICLTVPILAVPLPRLGIPEDAILLAASWGSCSLVATVYASKYCAPRWIALLSAIGFALFFVLVSLNDDVTINCVTAALILLALLAAVPETKSRCQYTRIRMAMVVLASLPLLFLGLLQILTNIPDNILTPPISYLLPTLMNPVVLLILVALTSPVLRKAYYWPSKE